MRRSKRSAEGTVTFCRVPTGDACAGEARGHCDKEHGDWLEARKAERDALMPYRGDPPAATAAHRTSTHCQGVGVSQLAVAASASTSGDLNAAIFTAPRAAACSSRAEAVDAASLAAKGRARRCATWTPSAGGACRARRSGRPRRRSVDQPGARLGMRGTLDRVPADVARLYVRPWARRTRRARQTTGSTPAVEAFARRRVRAQASAARQRVGAPGAARLLAARRQ